MRTCWAVAWLTWRHYSTIALVAWGAAALLGHADAGARFILNCHTAKLCRNSKACNDSNKPASWYASYHILSRSRSPEIGRVAAGRASGVKIPSFACWAYSRSCLCGCCMAADGHTVRSMSEINDYPGPHLIYNSLPIKLWQPDLSLEQFRRLLKTHLFS